MVSTTSDNIRDLAKSVLSISGAASMFGACQLGRMLDVRSPRVSAEDVTLRLDAVTQAVTDHLEGRFSSAFARTDVLQRDLVDVVTLNPPGLFASGGPIIETVASALDPLVMVVDRVMPEAEAGLQWRELRNKLEIYLLVENTETRLRISPVERTPLPELVERAYALGPFLAVWAIEGLGHVYGQQALRDSPTRRALLTGPEGDAVRPGALLMLHAGIGLAFAQSLLEPVDTLESLAHAIDRFVVLCRDNSRSGYTGAAYESLGLVTRTLHPSLIEPIDRWLCRTAPELMGFFWHGVGRALYFAPRNFIPCRDIDWANAPAIAHSVEGRLNVTAGLAWAVTLVNMRHPPVMERLLRKHGCELASNMGFADGVASSIVMRHETTACAPFVEQLLNYNPSPSEPRVVELWEHLVRRPAAAGLGVVYERLKAQSRLEEIFHYGRTPG